MKIQGILIFFGIVLLLSLGVAKTIQYFENQYEIQKAEKTEKRVGPKGKLCWFSKKVRGTNQRKAVGLCGKVKKIKRNSKGKLLFIKVFFPSTGNTVIFSCPETKHRGQWTQRGTTGGWWYLDRVPNTSPPRYKGECQGNDKGDKVRNLYLYLTK